MAVPPINFCFPPASDDVLHMSAALHIIGRSVITAITDAALHCRIPALVAPFRRQKSADVLVSMETAQIRWHGIPVGPIKNGRIPVDGLLSCRRQGRSAASELNPNGRASFLGAARPRLRCQAGIHVCVLRRYPSCGGCARGRFRNLK